MAEDGEVIAFTAPVPPSRPEVLFSEWSGRVPRVNSKYEEKPADCLVCGMKLTACTEGGEHLGRQKG